jgi:hypothetical protein
MLMRLPPTKTKASSPGTDHRVQEQKTGGQKKVKTQPNNDQLRGFLKDMKVKNAAVRRFVKKKMYHETKPPSPFIPLIPMQDPSVPSTLF